MGSLTKACSCSASPEPEHSSFTPTATSIPIDIDGEYVVDNGYAVAWEPTLTYQLTRGRKIRSFLFSDQLLLRFSGKGRIWLQSRSPRSLAAWVHPFRPVESKSN